MNDVHEFDVGLLIDQGRVNAFQISIVAWLCGLMAFEGYDLQAMAYAAPALLAEWHVGEANFGPILSAVILGYAIGAFGLSPLGDMIGRKTIVLAGIFIFSLFTLVTAWAPGPAALLVLRLLAGVGLGAAMPPAVALAAEFVPSRHRALTIGLTSTALAFGGALGGFLASLLMPVFGWQSVFYVGGLAPLPVCVALYRMLPESARLLALKGDRPRELGAIMRRIRPDLAFADDVRFTAAEEKAERFPAADLFKAGRMPLTLLLWFAFAVSFTGNYFLLLWLPKLLFDSGLTLATANFIGGMFLFGGAIGSFGVGMLIDRFGFHVTATVFFVGGILVAAFGMVSAGVPLAAIVFAAGVCVLGGQLGLIVTANILYPTAIRSTGTGWGLAAARIGAIIGPVVGGRLLAAGVPHAVMFAMAGSLAVLAAFTVAILFVLYRRSTVGVSAAPLPS